MEDVQQVVISIHGVESIGRWQDQIHPEFGGIDDFVHEPHNYGRFAVWKALVLPCRKRAIRAFYRKYSGIREKYPGVVPSVVAHSFGTYIVAQTLLTYPYVEFDRVILCGSIIASDYDWIGLVQRRRVRRIRNEVTGRDRVVQLFRWRLMRLLIPRTGPSGTHKFLCSFNELEQPTFPHFTHSDHFVANDHCRESWIPFLRGTAYFKDVCRRCLVHGPVAVEALAEFNREYGNLVQTYVELFFCARSPTAEQLSDYSKIVQRNVIEQGALGKRTPEKLIQRETLALLQVMSR